MAKDPAFLFYTADFLTGVMFMSNNEVGIYIKTLCILHQHGGRLPKDKIEKVVGVLPNIVLEKLELDKENNLFNRRLMEETIKRNAYCSSRKKNRMKKNICKTYEKHMSGHMENENEDRDRDRVGIIIKDKYLDYVLLSKEEHQKLVDKLGTALVDTYIDRLNNYIGSKGRRYKSHYYTILAWAQKDGAKKRYTPPTPPPPEPCDPKVAAENLAKLRKIVGAVKT